MRTLIKFPTVQQVAAYLDRVVNNLQEDEVTPDMLNINLALLQEAQYMLKGLLDGYSKVSDTSGK